MARCPKCGAEIDHLDYYEVAEVLYEAEYYGDSDYGDFSEPEVMFVNEQYYRCPRCGETLAENEEKARSIMEAEEQ
jgi:uncharacterized protein with PIN domain